MAEGSPGREWPPQTLSSCVKWIDEQAAEIARRDPPAVSDKLYLNDHGVPHIKNVLAFAGQLVSREFIPTTITEAETETLYAAVLSHDFGLYRHAERMDALDVRRDHARLSAIWIMEQERLPKQFARVLAAIVGAHSRGTNLSALEPFTYISDPFSANLRPQLLAAMLRVADALDIGQGRTPIAVYHHFAEQIPSKSIEHWRAHTLISGSELDLRAREVVLHLAYEADPLDPGVRMLYLALAEEFELIPAELWALQGCVKLHIVFAHRGKRLEPGRLYAAALDGGASR